MRNNRPKSENAAVKEHAAEDRNKIARQISTEREKAAAHPHGPAGKTPPKTGDR